MRPLPLLAVAGVLALGTGCSTVLTTPIQKVNVTSRPAGAQVYVDGVAQGRTPTSFEATRWQDHDVTIELRGYQPYHLHLSRRVNPWIAGNILNGFLIGMVVDASTGAIYKLDPPEIDADLFPRGIRRRPLTEEEIHASGHHSSVSGSRTLQIATVLHAQPGWQKIGQMTAQP